MLCHISAILCCSLIIPATHCSRCTCSACFLHARAPRISGTHFLVYGFAGGGFCCKTKTCKLTEDSIVTSNVVQCWTTTLMWKHEVPLHPHLAGPALRPSQMSRPVAGKSLKTFELVSYA